MEREKYNTSNKNTILNYIKKYNGNFTTKDLYNKLKDSNEHIGLTTIYRYIDELVEKGELKKYFNSENIAHYQYLNCNREDHFYLKCNKCNNLIHVDCDCINELKSHISNNHEFSIDNKNIIITGLCNKCKGDK